MNDHQDEMLISDKNLSEIFKPKTANCTAQAQEILGEILTNVLDASAELDKEDANWYLATIYFNNIKKLQKELFQL